MEKLSLPSETLPVFPADAEQNRVWLANEVFYKAFESLNMEMMDAVWLDADYVKCLHPGGELLSGRDLVMNSWQEIFSSTISARFQLAPVAVHVHGRMAWMVIQEEMSVNSGGQVNKVNLLTTNIFEKKDGDWRLVHHHSTIVPTEEPLAHAPKTIH
ncbi:MAG TPA: nuclear transport factor 2 family protein [Elusimicrobiota bacterium]|nr:nuclear transport factor 2 family protein [Elusimicrobiota bacterium]